MKGVGMAAQILEVLLVLYASYALIKIPFFFLLSYVRRRRAVDRAYGEGTSATKRSDDILLAFAGALIVLQWWTGVEVTSFLTGLLAGMTMIQTYFHRFSVPLGDDKAPKPPVSPIKLMSYAIQAEPGLAWKELAAIAALLLWSLARLATG
jgi:hypothetical protein